MKGTGKQILFSLILFGLISFSCYQYYVDYKYETIIGSYMLNAKDMNTPDKMLEQLQMARQGMINAGLTDNDYGVFIFKKPDNSMKFQYSHIDSIIERVEAVQQWKESTYGSDSVATENMGDVYEAKMTNLRNFIMEDTRSDWIAKDAWYVKYHFILYISWMVYMCSVLIECILAILICKDNKWFIWSEE